MKVMFSATGAGIKDSDAAVDSDDYNDADDQVMIWL